MKYFTAKEIADHKQDLRADFHRVKTSPPIRSGLAMKLMTAYSPDRQDKLLDCGTASGSFLQILHDAGYHNLYAVDIDDYLAIPRDIVKKLELLDVSNQPLPFPDAFFGAVTAWEFIEHLENPHNFYREVWRVLKPDGMFYVAMPNPVNLVSRVKFLLTGILPRFKEDNNHIAILPPCVFNKTFLKFFDPVEITYTQGRLPYFLKYISVPRNELFGHNVMYALRRRSAAKTS